MVSAQFSQLSGTKPLQNNTLPTLKPSDVTALDNVDLEFSDVFGPVPAQSPIYENVAVPDTNGLVYEDPAVIYSHSHSFVGPTTCVNQTQRLSRLTLRENDDSLELVQGVCKEADGKFQSPSENSIAGDSTVQEDSLLPKEVRLEDFEVLRVVGQGAFGKVYQVQKIDTSEIFAMKVMRKDKVLEKSQTEYMISERNILTTIDHPFIVQLKYSFQVTTDVYKLRTIII